MANQPWVQYLIDRTIREVQTTVAEFDAAKLTLVDANARIRVIITRNIEAFIDENLIELEEIDEDEDDETGEYQ